VYKILKVYTDVLHRFQISYKMGGYSSIKRFIGLKIEIDGIVVRLRVCADIQ